MLISRVSPLTGKNNIRDIPITWEQIAELAVRRKLIQDILPDISPDDREFIMTGYTPEDWACIFPTTQEEEDGEPGVVWIS